MSATVIIQTRPPVARARRQFVRPGTARRLWMRVWPLGVFQLLVIPAAVVRARALNFGFPVHAHPVGVERFIFFTWPNDMLQEFLLVHPVMLAASYIYGSWFLVPVVGAIPLMLYQPERYWRFVVPLAATYWACVPFYALYPLAPPWMHDANIVHVLGAVSPWAVKQ